MSNTLNTQQIKTDLKNNYDKIKKEFDKSVDKFQFINYDNGRTVGEWKAFGLKSVWGHWSASASNCFPTIREILDSASEQITNVTISCMGPHTDIGWHTGVQFKNALYKLAMKELESNDGSWKWSRDFVPEHKDIPITKGKYEVQRFHYGIDVPDLPLLMGLESEDKIYRWQNGETFSFKDYEAHRAWNHTDEYRYILIFDVSLSALSSAG